MNRRHLDQLLDDYDQWARSATAEGAQHFLEQALRDDLRALLNRARVLDPHNAPDAAPARDDAPPADWIDAADGLDDWIERFRRPTQAYQPGDGIRLQTPAGPVAGVVFSVSWSPKAGGWVYVCKLADDRGVVAAEADLQRWA